MIVDKTVQISYIIHLSEEEAKILRNMVQNPIGPPDEEPQDLYDFRINLFEALQEENAV